MKVFFLLVVLCYTTLSVSQSNTSIIVSGKVIDGETKDPLEYTTISIHHSVNDTIVSGTSTNKQGKFRFSVPSGTYTLKIRFLSFKTYELKSKSFTDDLNLGVIELQPDNQLNEVEIVAEKKLVETKFNKRIYNASKDIANSSGNAIDVLNNTPSVRVDNQGSVIVRGGFATILIDGKPQFGIDNNSDILNALPSNSIDKVEIITRSAKYSAEGGGAIINIVTKKRQGKGLNGSIEAHTGLPDNHGFSTFLNEDTDKMNLYSTISFNHTDNLKEVDYEQPLLNLFTENDEDRVRNSFLFNLGSDFYLNDKNILNTSLLVNLINKNYYSNIESSDFLRNSSDKDNVSRLEGQLGYTAKFNENGHQVSSNFKYETFISDNNASIVENQLPGNSIFQKVDKDQNLDNFLAQVDYNLPINNGNGLFSAGYLGTFRLYDNTFKVEQFNETITDFEIINDLDNTIAYDELVHGVYAQFENTSNAFTYSLGLRTEVTNVKIEDKANIIKRDKSYTDLFPSASVALEFGESSYLSLSYARAIERPDISQISPFIGYSDERFQSVGNLDLNPMYNDYVELLYDTSFGKFTFTSVAFMNHNKDNILTVFEDTGTQTENGDSIFRRIPINSGNYNSIGVDADITYTPFKGLRLNTYATFYQSKLTNAIDETYNFSNNVFYGRLNAFISLKNGLKFTVRQTHQSTVIIGLREQKSLNYTNLTVSKDLFNKKASLTFNAIDLFATRKGKITSLESNTRTIRNIFFENQFTLSFTYRFNQKRRSSKDRSKELNKDKFEDTQDKKF